MQTHSGAAATAAGALVMVVDDDDLLRESIATLLHGHGFRVVQHDSGSAALQALAGGVVPDLILLDLQMPEMSGWEFRQQQLADAELASIPVLVMSADQSPMAAAVDATAFLSKPVGTSTLLRSVKSAVSSNRLRRGSSVHARVDTELSPALAAGAEGGNEWAATQLVHSAELAAEKLREQQLALVARAISHVVNNAMQGLISYAQCPSSTQLDDLDLQQSVLSSARHCAEVLQKFAGAALTESPLQHADGMALAPASLPLAWDRLCPEGVELHVSGLPLLRSARIDPHTLLLMTTELIQNAVEALPQRTGTIKIRVSQQLRALAELSTALPLANRRAGVWCCIEVVDDGEGIQASALSQIWLAFYSTRFPGRGLGLASVLARMKALGGLVESHSAPGEGTSVKLLLPLRCGDGAAEA